MRRYLLVLLVLLQMIAPLVHAHSGTDFARFGLHLPNFEVYSVSTQQNSPVLQSLDALSNSDEAIVSISTGIKNQYDSVDDLSPLLYFSPALFIFAIILTSCNIHFLPPSLPRLTTLVHSPQSPRAPPRLASFFEHDY